LVFSWHRVASCDGNAQQPRTVRKPEGLL
jgi:hypothetical protein